MNSAPACAPAVERSAASYRILVIDDNPQIHADLRKILRPTQGSDTRTDELESLLFGEVAERGSEVVFELDSAMQGQDGLRMLNDALAEGRPYALAFVDVRMPPGWDGIETVNHLWDVYPGLQVVICTAYSDYSWERMRATLRHPDSLVVLKKPFDNMEVQQLAHTLARKWELDIQAVAGIQQLDKNIRRLLAPTGGQRETTPDPGDELAVEMVASCDGRQFVGSLVRLSGAVESTRRQLREAEENLVQSEKMAALGRLSAGIIHEINNPLNYALAALGMLESTAQHMPEKLREDHLDALHDIRDGLARVAGITGSLRKFAHPDSGSLVEVRVNECVETALRLLSAELKNGIAVENRISPDLTVWASGSRLSQVFINLIHKAVHALSAKRFGSGEGPRIRLEAGLSGDRTWIRVTDNGTGIAAEHIDKIFDPFFTTKGVGQGTGLGLGICQRIMRSFDGSLTAESVPGEFTSMVLDLPQAET